MTLEHFSQPQLPFSCFIVYTCISVSDTASVPDLSGLNTCVAMIFICKHMKHHVSREVSSRVTMRGEGGVTGEGRLVGERRFNS